jgi:hypothetical protein
LKRRDALAENQHREQDAESGLQIGDYRRLDGAQQKSTGILSKRANEKSICETLYTEREAIGFHLFRGTSCGVGTWVFLTEKWQSS